MTSSAAYMAIFEPFDYFSSGSGVIVLTDKQSKPQTDNAENNTTLATLRYTGSDDCCTYF